MIQNQTLFDELNAKWCPPKECTYKINIDASILSLNEVEMQVIIRDHKGQTIPANSNEFRYEQTFKLVKEHFGVVLSLALNIALQYVHIENDNLGIVENKA